MSDLFNEVMRELDWDDEISKESTFSLLPAGEYDFVVTKMERSRHNGSDKLPPCLKAILTLEVKDEKGNTAILTHNLFLHTKCEGKISAFLISIGQKKHNMAIKPNWSAVPGSKGRAKIAIKEWTGDDGVVRQSNEVKRFLEPSAPPVPTTSFTPGKF